MCQHVCLEVRSLCAFVFTLVAAERLFSGMNKNVNFQIGSICERGGTHGASVIFPSSLLCFPVTFTTHWLPLLFPPGCVLLAVLAAVGGVAAV